MCNYYRPHASCLTTNHLWGERERVVWSICVAWAVKYPFQRCIFREENFALPKCSMLAQEMKILSRG